MKPISLWQFSLVTQPEAEDALSAWVAEFFRVPVASYTHVDTRRVTLTACFERKPAWGAAERVEVAAAIQRARDHGLETGEGVYSLRRLAKRDWAESWKRHFQPVQFGPRLLLKPTWSKRRPAPGQKVVVLDPGLSFGTGRHPTTAFCLRQVARWHRPGTAQSLLDIGTGSGILAIAAAKLGYRPIRAFDFDPEAVRTARLNGSRNRVEVPFSRFDVSRLPANPRQRYAMVCANLMANLLLAEVGRIVAQVAAGGVLALAGILLGEFPAVQERYEAAGLRLIASRQDHEWWSGAFRKPV